MKNTLLMKKDMKKIITLMLACATLTAHAQTADSLDVSAPPTYPQLVPISYNEEMNKDIMHLRFSKADAAAKKLIQTAKRKRQSTAEYDRVVSICRKGESGLRGVDRVTIIDSVVVDKSDFLKAYPLSPDLGTLTLSGIGDKVQYQTQLNGMVLRPESESDSTHLHLTRYYLESVGTSRFSSDESPVSSRLTEGEPVEGLGIEGDINYPFLMPDGQTFYFSARTDDGYGNYDLYATRYDSDSKRFYQAENMGFPYSIYTFIPNESRQTIDYETTDLAQLLATASLRSIASIPLTDEQKKAKTDAIRRVKQLTATASIAHHKDFEFVINDTKTYCTLDDFLSSDAKKLCSNWLQKSKNLATLNEQLQQMRDTSPEARQQILNLETRIMELQTEVHQLEKSIRKAELQ